MILKVKVNSAVKTPVDWKNVHECQWLIALTLPMFRNGGDRKSHRDYLIKTISYAYSK